MGNVSSGVDCVSCAASWVCFGADWVCSGADWRIVAPSATVATTACCFVGSTKIGAAAGRAETNWLTMVWEFVCPAVALVATEEAGTEEECIGACAGAGAFVAVGACDGIICVVAWLRVAVRFSTKAGLVAAERSGRCRVECGAAKETLGAADVSWNVVAGRTVPAAGAAEGMYCEPWAVPGPWFDGKVRVGVCDGVAW